MQDRAEEGEDLGALKGNNNKVTNIPPHPDRRAEHKSRECQRLQFTKHNGINVFQGLVMGQVLC